MKKLLLLILFFTVGVSFVSAASISDVSVSFCNSGTDGRSLNFLVKAGEPYNFCVKMVNSSKEDVSIDLSFVDGELTSDGLQKKACSSQGELFGPYVLFPTRHVNLKPGTGVQITGSLFYPLGYFGNIHGCLAYTMSNQDSYVEQDSSFLNVVVRKVNFIDGYVVGTFKRDVSFVPSNIVYYEDTLDGSLVVSLVFDNKGIVPELFRFTGSLVNGLGYERSISSAQELRSNTGTTIVFRFSDFPFYKGLYTFSFQGQSVLDTKLDLSYVPENDKHPLDFSYTKKMIIVPWTIVLVGLGFLLALFFLRAILKFILRR